MEPNLSNPLLASNFMWVEMIEPIFKVGNLLFKKSVEKDVERSPLSGEWISFYESWDKNGPGIVHDVMRARYKKNILSPFRKGFYEIDTDLYAPGRNHDRPWKGKLFCSRNNKEVIGKWESLSRNANGHLSFTLSLTGDILVGRWFGPNKEEEYICGGIILWYRARVPKREVYKFAKKVYGYTDTQARKRLFFLLEE